MRLWHQLLIPHLDRQRLLGQHRELAALRGNGWGRKHATVNYVFMHEPEKLVAYHFLILQEMKKRGYHPDDIWYNACWRGKTLGEQENWVNFVVATEIALKGQSGEIIYPEHNNAYLRECIENLRGKGIDVTEMEALL